MGGAGESVATIVEEGEAGKQLSERELAEK